MNRQKSKNVIACLADNGCPNITDDLDPASCSPDPISAGGFGDVYYGKLQDGFPVAIKTMRIQGHADKIRKPLKVGSFCYLAHTMRTRHPERGSGALYVVEV